MEETTGLERKRFLMMLSSAFVIFFTGFPHVWSVYQPYVMEQAGWSQTESSMCFYLALATFVFGNICGGRMMEKHGSGKVMWIGGWIFSAGVVLSAFLIVSTPVPFYLTYGVMQGFGQGMIYTTVVANAQKWFPGRTGFASGIIVTANGLCGFFLAPISRRLLGQMGPKWTLFSIGMVIAAAWFISSILFSVPDEEWRLAREAEILQKNGRNANLALTKQYTSKEMIGTKKFYYLLATMCFGLMSYFMLSPVSQSYQIEMGIPGSIAVSAVMIGSLMNAGTRLILPTIADRIGRIPCIRLVIIVSIGAMAVLGCANSYPVTAAIIVMYGCYGGIMGSFPSFTSSIFGLKHSGENYGFVMFGIVIATIGAPVITSVITAGGLSMRIVFFTGMGFAVAALISLGMLQKAINKKEETGEKAYAISDNEKIIGACER